MIDPIPPLPLSSTLSFLTSSFSFYTPPIIYHFVSLVIMTSQFPANHSPQDSLKLPPRLFIGVVEVESRRNGPPRISKCSGLSSGRVSKATWMIYVRLDHFIDIRKGMWRSED
ncbi:hypothetical protein E2C01_052628 [Portunus trituberculatus]|uniref:Uncharacterized protein n=1 Tax=Portunus trituberculatus TaxID=210409 RepID=A0A5B7GF66_PORTR|nr:hypothetical protein [Portunus trituberculatus]